MIVFRGDCMSNFLYVAPLPIDFNEHNGVTKKILSHIKVFEKYYSTYLLYYYNGYVLLSHDGLTKRVKKGNNSYAVLKSISKIGKNFSKVYVRYPKSSPFFISFLKKLKSSTIVVEIPTYPYDLEGGETFLTRLQRFVDFQYRKKIKKYVSRIVTFSDDRFIFGIETIKTINGIDFDITPLSKKIDYNNTFHFIAVSNMYDINGYERLIMGLKDYYSFTPSHKIIFDIVGDGPARAKYERIVRELGLEQYVIFHGLKFGDELQSLYDRAILGVNSLAIHRHNLKKESTLKSREYCAEGLLILSSSSVDSLSVQGNSKFVISVDANDDVINVQLLIDSIINVISKYSDSLALKEAIRNDAYQICDVNKTLKPVIDYLGE